MMVVEAILMRIGIISICPQTFVSSSNFNRGEDHLMEVITQEDRLLTWHVLTWVEEDGVEEVVGLLLNGEITGRDQEILILEAILDRDAGE